MKADSISVPYSLPYRMLENGIDVIIRNYGRVGRVVICNKIVAVTGSDVGSNSCSGSKK